MISFLNPKIVFFGINEQFAIKIVPDFLESDLLEVLADLEEKYDGAMVFKTDKEACEMIS